MYSSKKISSKGISSIYISSRQLIVENLYRTSTVELLSDIYKNYQPKRVNNVYEVALRGWCPNDYEQSSR